MQAPTVTPAPPPTGTRFVLASIAAVPAALAITAIVPAGARPGVFVAGLAVVATLGVVGGLRARTALLRGVPHTVRTTAIAIVGLTVGAVAAISCLAAAVRVLA